MRDSEAKKSAEVNGGEGVERERERERERGREKKREGKRGGDRGDVGSWTVEIS